MNESIDELKVKKFIFYITSLNSPVCDSSQNYIDVKVHLYDNRKRKIASVSSSSPSLKDCSVSIIFPSSQDDFETIINKNKDASHVATVRIDTTNATYSYVCLCVIQRRRRSIKTNTLQSFQKFDTIFNVEVDMCQSEAALETKEICLGAFDSTLPRHTGTVSTSLEIIAVLFKTMHPKRKTLVWAFFPTSQLFLMEDEMAGVKNKQKTVDCRLMTIIQSIDAMKVTKRDTLHFIEDLLDSREIAPGKDVTKQKPTETLELSNELENRNVSNVVQHKDSTLSLKLKKELMESQEKVNDSLNEIWSIVRNDIEHFDSRLSAAYRYSSKCLNKGNFNESKSSLNHFKEYTLDKKSSSKNASFERSSIKTKMALKNLRDSLQKDFLVTDNNESPLRKTVKGKEMYTQMAYLIRDMQLLQQRQQEILALITSPSQSEVEEEIENFNAQPIKLHDETACSKEDPFVREFLQFTKSVEQVSQLSGASFRRLQQALHYPESFPSLSNHLSFPSSRKLLEFITSKKATDFMKTLEVLAGVWRSAGTGITTDPISINVSTISNKERAPWWQTRPLKPAV